MTDVRITHIGGPTTLIEVGGWRLLTDPTFDPPGRRYAFGWGTSSRKKTGPAVSIDELPPIDVVLLTHDQHADNLDDAGRALLPRAGRVVTTTAGASRLGGDTIGLSPWSTSELRAPDRPTVEIVATPARHGPPLSRPITGAAVGFVLRWADQEHGVLWITGDTVRYGGMRKVGARFTVGTLVLHLGAVQFGITGPLKYTMTARAGAAVCAELRPRTVIPVHYEGWSHFSQDRAAAEQAFAAGPTSLTWLTPGSAKTVSV